MPNANDNSDILYHYTSQQGLLGILAQKELWASQIHFLNDSMEFWHAFEVARNELQRQLEGAHDQVKEKLETLLGNLDSTAHVGVCVSSFSEHGDSLSQWRAYCGDGAGFAIGFAREELRALGEREGFTLQPCEYDDDAQKARVLKTIDEVMSTDFDTFPGFQNPIYPNEIVIFQTGGNFIECLTKLAPLLKHTSFMEEREWRLVSPGIPPERLCYRPGASMITPYFRLPLTADAKLNCIKRIVIGPTPHPKLSEKSVDDLLVSSGFPRFAVEVRTSATPFRNW